MAGIPGIGPSAPRRPTRGGPSLISDFATAFGLRYSIPEQTAPPPKGRCNFHHRQHTLAWPGPQYCPSATFLSPLSLPRLLAWCCFRSIPAMSVGHRKAMQWAARATSAARASAAIGVGVRGWQHVGTTGGAVLPLCSRGGPVIGELAGSGLPQQRWMSGVDKKEGFEYYDPTSAHSSNPRPARASRPPAPPMAPCSFVAPLQLPCSPPRSGPAPHRFASQVSR